jgi:hypothetical protein
MAGLTISEPQDPEKLYGSDQHTAKTHLGETIRPIGRHVFCLRLPMPQPYEGIEVPEQHLAPYGKHQAGAPLQPAIVLAIGPDVHEVKVGDRVIIDPMNSNPMKFGDSWYFFPVETMEDPDGKIINGGIMVRFVEE